MKKMILNKKIIVFISVAIVALAFKICNREYISLEYVGSVENADFSVFRDVYGIPDDFELAWWEQFSAADIRRYSLEDILADNYNIILTEPIDINEKDLIVSFGRKLEMLYYDNMYINDGAGREFARPVFDEEYNEGVAYLYVIERIELYNNELVSNDMYYFNLDGDIPFKEIWWKKYRR